MVKAAGDSGKMAVAAFVQKVQWPPHSGPKGHLLAAADESCFAPVPTHKATHYCATHHSRVAAEAFPRFQPTHAKHEKKGPEPEFRPQ